MADITNANANANANADTNTNATDGQKRLAKIARRKPLRRVRRYALLVAALIFVGGSSTWANWQRFTHGPRRVNEQQFASLLNAPNIVTRVIEGHGLRYVSLSKPLFVDAGFTWQSTIGQTTTTTSEFKFIVLPDRVVLARTRPGQSDLGSGVLHPMDDDISQSATEAAARFGKKTKLSPLVFDTTFDPRAGLAIRIASMIFALTFALGLLLRALIAVLRPLRNPLILPLGQSDSERIATMQRIAPFVFASRSDRSEFVSGHLVHHDGDSFAAVAIADSVWAHAALHSRKPFAIKSTGPTHHCACALGKRPVGPISGGHRN
jgi:hypothetical protein